MSIATATRTTIIVQMLLTCGFVAALIISNDLMYRVGYGAGSAVVVYTSLRQMIKIGYESGRTRAIADMLREHCRLQSD